MERVSYKSYRDYFKEREEKRIKDITDKMTHQEMLISPNGTFTKHWSYKNDPFLYPYELDDKYCYEDCMTTLKAYHDMAYGYPKPNDRIEKVIFNNPATIVLWADGTKTVIKCDKEDEFDSEKGLAMAIAKKYLGTNKSGSNYYDVFEKWVPKKEKKVFVGVGHGGVSTEIFTKADEIVSKITDQDGNESKMIFHTDKDEYKVSLTKKIDSTTAYEIQNRLASKMIGELVENATKKIDKTQKGLIWLRNKDNITFRDGHTERLEQSGTLCLIYDDEDIDNIVKITRYTNDDIGVIVEEIIYEEETNETI